MATAVLLPALSPTMKEGKITRWLKKEGDKITSGTAIAECETDKSNLEIEAYEDGVLLKILVKEGELAPVGGPIAFIGQAGEQIDDAQIKAATPAPSAAPAPAPQAAPAAAKSAIVPPAPPAASSGKAAPPAPPPPPVVRPPDPTSATGVRLKASPLAKRMASDAGVDLKQIAGSGPQGRIVKRDIEQAMAQPAAAAKAAAPSETAAPTARVPVSVYTTGAPPEALPLTTMRKVIAQRLTEVKPGVPHFYLHINVEMDEALKLREQAKGMELKVSVNDIIVKATAVAVRHFPRINQIWDNDKLLQSHAVDVGVAVAIEDGLITPIVRDADHKGLAEISAEIRDLAERAKRKALKPEEYTGGSITVSNLGMFGIDSFIAIINPPQSAILAVGVVTPTPVVRDGQVVVRQMMAVTLSGDHRVIDGAVGAQYLKVLKALLEQPIRLVF